MMTTKFRYTYIYSNTNNSKILLENYFQRTCSDNHNTLVNKQDKFFFNKIVIIVFIFKYKKLVQFY